MARVTTYVCDPCSVNKRPRPDPVEFHVTAEDAEGNKFELDTCRPHLLNLVKAFANGKTIQLVVKRKRPGDNGGTRPSGVA